MAMRYDANALGEPDVTDDIATHGIPRASCLLSMVHAFGR
jgi:hypothetical protein